LREHGHDDTDTLVAVTADHGEEFLEHGRFLHSETLFDEMVRVPLVLRGPNVPVGKRVARQVRHVDLSATLLAVAGAAVEGVEGESLVGRWDTPSRPAVAARSTKYLALRTPERKLVVSFLAYPRASVTWIPGLGLREMKEIALVRPPRDKVGLWHLDADPGEREDVFALNRLKPAPLRGAARERALPGSPRRAPRPTDAFPPTPAITGDTAGAGLRRLSTLPEVLPTSATCAGASTSARWPASAIVRTPTGPPSASAKRFA
jgi:arylsulfatase A-like enzyme